MIPFSWWTFRIFYIFFWSGEGKGESKAPRGGGGRFLLKIPGGGGGLFRAGGGGSERAGVCREFGGGG